MMKRNNKKFVFFFMIWMISWVVLSRPVGAEENKDSNDNDDNKNSEYKESGLRLESEKYIEKINSTEHKPLPMTKQICGKTPNPIVCEHVVIHMHNDSEPDINPRNVLDFQLTALKEDVALACQDAEDNKNRDKPHEFCLGSYKKADDEMVSAIKKSQGDDMKEVSILVSGAMKHVESCQAQLEADPTSTSGFKIVNPFLKKLADNAVAIANDISIGILQK